MLYLLSYLDKDNLQSFISIVRHYKLHSNRFVFLSKQSIDSYVILTSLTFFSFLSIGGLYLTHIVVIFSCPSKLIISIITMVLFNMLLCKYVTIGFEWRNQQHVQPFFIRTSKNLSSKYSVEYIH